MVSSLYHNHRPNAMVFLLIIISKCTIIYKSIIQNLSECSQCVVSPQQRLECLEVVQDYLQEQYLASYQDYLSKVGFGDEALAPW